MQQPQAGLPTPPPGGPASPPTAWVSGCVGRASPVMCGAPAGASLAGGHRCAQPGGCRGPPGVSPRCLPLPLPSPSFPVSWSPSCGQVDVSPGRPQCLARPHPQAPSARGWFHSRCPPGLASASDSPTSPPPPGPGASREAAGSRGCCQHCSSLGSRVRVDLGGVLSQAAEFSLRSCVCFLRSDPAQQPAPGAPEGGAPEGGAPEGAAPGGGPPGAPPNLSSNRRLQQTQAQVQEVSSSASPAGFPEGCLDSFPTALQQRCS